MSSPAEGANNSLPKSLSWIRGAASEQGKEREKGRKKRVEGDVRKHPLPRHKFFSCCWVQLGALHFIVKKADRVGH